MISIGKVRHYFSNAKVVTIIDLVISQKKTFLGGHSFYFSTSQHSACCASVCIVVSLGTIDSSTFPEGAGQRRRVSGC